MNDDAAAGAVRRYHARSTHRPARYAAGPDHLDWDSQPEPFRWYEGAPRLELPLAGDELGAVTWGGLHRPGAVAPHPVGRKSLGAFLELALGVTAWKQYGGVRWALRANPSSGNLHPTEGYVVVAGATDVPAGVHHYLSRDHVLERRFAPSPPSASRLARLLPPRGFLLGLASIHWREAWKYGERAYRYCQHDAGHALASARYAAAVLGWSARLLLAPGDDDVAALLGLDRERDHRTIPPVERERPEALVAVAPGAESGAAPLEDERSLDALRACLGDGAWSGAPNPLSPEHVAWRAITKVAEAAAKPRTPGEAGAPERAGAPTPSSADHSAEGLSALRLIRQRRSAVDLDGETGLESPRFYALVDRLLPRASVPPWDVLPWPPHVHPVFFLHRVGGLPSGIYALVRNGAASPALHASMRPSFAWRAPDGAPRALPLALLEAEDARPLARFASCRQEIASDSAFAVAMLADTQSLEREPWWYRRLHWEAGVLGHAIYLEAEAAGRRGTGIGCFFDDVVHETLGLADARFRDLYHFTVGGAVEDRRLTTLPAYGEAVRRRS